MKTIILEIGLLIFSNKTMFLLRRSKQHLIPLKQAGLLLMMEVVLASASK
jgi:hypothetical protein